LERWLLLKPHGYSVFLPPELYLAIVRLQADKQLGRAYPVLYSINEGLFHLGYISKEVYEVYEKRYSEPLIKEKPTPLTTEQLKEQEKIERLTKTFSIVLEQWNEHPSREWREKWVKESEKWKDKIPSAKLVLALANSREVEVVGG
jgi:hypothetical protein